MSDAASRSPDDTRRDAPHDGPGAGPTKGAAARLLSLASHELRTPASVISGYLRMLQRDAASFSDRQRKMVDEAEKACVKMVGLIGEMSEAAQLDDGRTRLKSEALDLLVLLHEVADQANLGSDRGIRIALRGGDGPAIIQGDDGQLRTAFSSLLGAVVREQPDDAHVIANWLWQQDGALIVIGRETEVDTAAAKPAAPFDDGRGGMGMKLPIARRVIEQHGGRVWSPAGPDGLTRARGAILVWLPVVNKS